MIANISNEIKEKKYPLLINGELFFLNKNPFEYSLEGVETHWQNQIEHKIKELMFDEFLKGKPEPSSVEELEDEAIRMLSIRFLADDKFIEHYKEDGYDLLSTKDLLQTENVYKEKIDDVSLLI